MSQNLWKTTKQFLCQQREQLLKQHDAPLALVLGNEASDLDSIISSILYAQYLQLQRPSETVIPILTIENEELALRPEVVYLFQRFNLQASDLFFLEEDNTLQEVIKAKEASNTLNVILTDHNLMMKHLHNRWENRVTEIIDHHEDAQAYLYLAPEKRTIQMVGSATTLVADRIFKDPQIDCNHPEDALKERNTFLLATILIDTANMDPKINKAKDLDIQMVTRLMEALSWSKEQATELYSKLSDIKFDVSHFTTNQLLRMDYKEDIFGKYNVAVGISSIRRSQEEILKDDNLFENFEQWYTKKKLHVLCAMIAYSDSNKQFHRELIIYSHQSQAKKVESLVEFLKDSEMQLVASVHPAPTRDPHRFHFFQQKNLAASRKQLQPLCKKFFTEVYQEE